MNDIYYNIEDDFNKYPDAWCYVIWSERKRGKTYSVLDYMKLNNEKFVFLKRTNDDIKLLCAGSGKIGSKLNDYGIDLSPFVPLNRDKGYNVKAFQIHDGLGAFWNCNSDLEPIESPIGYLLSNNAIQKFRGFDLSVCNYQIFDEFIPQPYERINRLEGEMLLDLYMTVSRDRVERGRGELKLILLANGNMISNPVMNTLEITDIAGEMEMNNIEYHYIEDRRILLHAIPPLNKDKSKEDMTGIEAAMLGTNWGDMTFGGKFGYDDFSNVKKFSLKRFQPFIEIIYKKKYYYIYNKEGFYYMCKSKSNKCLAKYNLDKENDQKRFWLEYGILLREACVDERMKFQTYNMYDLIVNYKKFFRL